MFAVCHVSFENVYLNGAEKTGNNNVTIVIRSFSI